MVKPESELRGRTAEGIVRSILDAVPVPIEEPPVRTASEAPA